MELRLENFQESPTYFFRRCGYGVYGAATSDNEWSFVRRLSSGDYPRFHVYAKMDGDDFLVNLHLDQKRPSYEGTRAHSGEYDGALVVEEAERIKTYANQNKTVR